MAVTPGEFPPGFGSDIFIGDFMDVIADLHERIAEIATPHGRAWDEWLAGDPVWLDEVSLPILAEISGLEWRQVEPVVLGLKQACDPEAEPSIQARRHCVTLFHGDADFLGNTEWHANRVLALLGVEPRGRFVRVRNADALSWDDDPDSWDEASLSDEAREFLDSCLSGRWVFHSAICPFVRLLWCELEVDAVLAKLRFG